MTEHQWWKTLAILGTILNACWIGTVAIPDATFRYFVLCTLQIRPVSQPLVMLGAFVLTLPISLTFATDAARNQRLTWDGRVSWTLSLILASPIAIPRYWWRFLRIPKQSE